MIQMCLGVEGSHLGVGSVQTQRHPELKGGVKQRLKTAQSTPIITFEQNLSSNDVWSITNKMVFSVFFIK